MQSAYVELQVPLVSRDMDIPFVQSVDMQLAARYENFDTFGSVTKPKVALSWRPFDWMLVRSAWSEGFRAPNLQQQYEAGLQRSNIRTDFIRCEARPGATNPAVRVHHQLSDGCGVIAVGDRLTDRAATALEPEESTNLTYGFVFESTFLPPEYGEITFTADWWRIEQSNVVGIFGDDNHILLDYVLRLQGQNESGGGARRSRCAGHAGLPGHRSHCGG